MPFRVGQESGRKGWYVYVDRPKTHRTRRGGKTVRRKSGDTREEALKNALRIEAELVQQWAADESLNPFQAALRTSRELEVRLDEALDWELRDQGYKPQERDRLLLGLYDRRDVEAQGLEVWLSREEYTQLKGIKTGIRPWTEWVRERKALEERAASTVVNWETKLRGLAACYGSDVVGTITRKEGNAYKLHMKESGMSTNSISNYLGTFSGFWNWAISSGELKGENSWKGQRKGLPKVNKRKALCPDLLERACEKVDELKDIGFFFGRHQGLRKEDYCGLRWCDVDLENELIYLRRYSWEGKKRNLKLGEGGERSIPIHSELSRLIGQRQLHEMINNRSGKKTTKQYWSVGVLRGPNELRRGMAFVLMT